MYFLKSPHKSPLGLKDELIRFSWSEVRGHRGLTAVHSYEHFSEEPIFFFLLIWHKH